MQSRQSIRRLVSTNSKVLNFADATAFKSKSLTALARSFLVFKICTIPVIVRNAETMLKLSYKTLGLSLTNAVLKQSFFGHFCAGEDEKTIQPTVDYLQKNGIGSILDYAAESDVEVAKEAVSGSTGASLNSPGVQCRVYDYSTEEDCDKHTETFVKCIRAVHAVSPTGFAAIKCTALGNPELLRRASIAIVELHNLFQAFDAAKTGYVTRDQFTAAFQKYFTCGDIEKIFESLDVDRDGKIDYIEWSNKFVVEELHMLTDHCRERGPLALATLDENERVLMKRMKERVCKLADLASSLGVRLMIDAEHTYLQPAIDNITADLFKKYNKTSFPVIFGTYQMYLKDSRERLFIDMARAQAGQYKFAAKLVRGAYMVLERAHAAKEGLADPIHATLQATHDNYNGAVREIITRIAAGHAAEVMIASHNQQSVELALEAMRDHKLTPGSAVYFGQLLGMSDHLTFTLGNAGYKAYKYVPYGKVNEVMPYLIRRAQENSDALGPAQNEIRMIKSEISRRMK